MDTTQLLPKEMPNRRSSLFNSGTTKSPPSTPPALKSRKQQKRDDPDEGNRPIRNEDLVRMMQEFGGFGTQSADGSQSVDDSDEDERPLIIDESGGEPEIQVPVPEIPVVPVPEPQRPGENEE